MIESTSGAGWLEGGPMFGGGRVQCVRFCSLEAEAGAWPIGLS